VSIIAPLGCQRYGLNVYSFDHKANVLTFIS
jgi:hypothetical protein